jgi:hypothetical protein
MYWIHSILSTTYRPLIEYSSVIMVEPMLFSFEMMKEQFNAGEAGALKRRDIWPSREDAYHSMKLRSTFQAWDDRVLRIFVVSRIVQLALIYTVFAELDRLGARFATTADYRLP